MKIYTSYNYYVRNPAGWSDKYSFRVPMSNNSVRVVVVGDMGADVCSDAVIEAIESNILNISKRIDFFLIMAILHTPNSMNIFMMCLCE